MNHLGLPRPIIFGVIDTGKCHDYHGINTVFHQKYKKQIKICALEFALRFTLGFQLGFALGFTLGVTLAFTVAFCVA